MQNSSKLPSCYRVGKPRQLQLYHPGILVKEEKPERLRASPSKIPRALLLLQTFLPIVSMSSGGIQHLSQSCPKLFAIALGNLFIWPLSTPPQPSDQICLYPGHMAGLQVGSPVRARARGSQSMLLSHINVSLPLFLPPFPSL